MTSKVKRQEEGRRDSQVAVAWVRLQPSVLSRVAIAHVAPAVGLGGGGAGGGASCRGRRG